MTPDALLVRAHDFDCRAQTDDLYRTLATVYRLLAEMAQPDLTAPTAAPRPWTDAPPILQGLRRLPLKRTIGPAPADVVG